MECDITEGKSDISLQPQCFILEGKFDITPQCDILEGKFDITPQCDILVGKFDITPKSVISHTELIWKSTSPPTILISTLDSLTYSVTN